MRARAREFAEQDSRFRMSINEPIRDAIETRAASGIAVHDLSIIVTTRIGDRESAGFTVTLEEILITRVYAREKANYARYYALSQILKGGWLARG